MTGAKPAPCAQGPQSGGELHRTMMPWSETWIRNPETSSYKPNQKQGFNVGAAARHRPGSGSRHILSRELRSGATTSNPAKTSYNPAYLWRVLHLHHLHHQRPGPGQEFVSSEPLASDNQSEGCLTGFSQAVPHCAHFPGPCALISSARSVSCLGWILWKLLWDTQQSSERTREMLLPLKIYTSLTIFHCFSVCIAVSEIRFFHIPDC